MASVAAAYRLSARLRTRSHVFSRGFGSSTRALAAHSFAMPAMSPTMTEGKIASWKVKEGDSFTAGDVLLEIETDKAQIEVEAQDDGIMAKITQSDGAKGIKVGTPIAITADPGDDISSLDLSAAESSAPKTPSKDEQSTSPQEESSSALDHSTSKSTMESSPPAKPAETSRSTSSAVPQKQTYPLYPSVEHLLHTSGLSAADADKIPASGPGGRLLKGDVLAYLGKIQQSYPAELQEKLSKREHLDLSNIKLSASKKATGPKETAAEAATVPEADLDIEVAVPVSLTAVIKVQKRVQDTLGIFLPLSTFIARAAEVANDDLPQSAQAKSSPDALFNQVLGLDKISGAGLSRGNFMPQVTALTPPTNAIRAAAPVRASQPVDIIDILAGKAPRKPSSSPQVHRVEGVMAGSPGSMNVFSVIVPKGDEKRGEIFLERVKMMLEAEPGRLVV